jgi:hypothetical protein
MDLLSHGRGSWFDPSIAHSKIPANDGKRVAPGFWIGGHLLQRGEELAQRVLRNLCGLLSFRGEGVRAGVSDDDDRDMSEHLGDGPGVGFARLQRRRAGGPKGYNGFTNLKVELPAEVVEALGPEPEREVLEGVLLLLVSQGKMSVARAGEILGLESRISAIRWYTRHGLPYPDLSEEDLADDLKYASS